MFDPNGRNGPLPSPEHFNVRGNGVVRATDAIEHWIAGYRIHQAADFRISDITNNRFPILGYIQDPTSNSKAKSTKAKLWVDAVVETSLQNASTRMK